MNLIKLLKICADKEQFLLSLQEWGLIPHQGDHSCPSCKLQLLLGLDSSRPEGYRWRCKNKIVKSKKKLQDCNQMKEFRAGTFFEGSKLQVSQILGFVNFWVQGASLKMIANEMKINLKYCVDWSSFCREVLILGFNSKKHKLGGRGKVVVINESKFGNANTIVVTKFWAWVFGGYEQGSRHVFMGLV